jgi:hypothetical protein
MTKDDNEQGQRFKAEQESTPKQPQDEQKPMLMPSSIEGRALMEQEPNAALEEFTRLSDLLRQRRFVEVNSNHLFGGLECPACRRNRKARAKE